MRSRRPARRRRGALPRRTSVASLIGIVTLLTLWTMGCSLFSAPRYRGPKSHNFDGERFVNQGEVRTASFGDFLRWQLTKDQRPWRRWTEAPPWASTP